MRGHRRAQITLLGVAAITASVLTLASVSSAPAASRPADGPRLAITALTSFQPRGLSVRTVVPDGSAQRLLLRGSRRGIQPNPLSSANWSPDGTWLYFAGSQGRRSGIYKLRADGTGLRFLRGTWSGSNPVLSADGRKLAFTRARLGGGPLGVSASVWVGRASGGGAFRLTPWRGIELVPTSFAPDGSALAVTHSDLIRGKSTVLLYGPKKNGPIKVLARQASDAAFSPDGTRIAIVRHTPSRRGFLRFAVDKDLRILNADGSPSSRVTRTNGVAETRPSWDPSGERLAFNAFRNSKNVFDAIFDGLLPFGNSVVEVNADGTCRRKIMTLRDAILRAGSWQPGPDRAAGRIEC